MEISEEKLEKAANLVDALASLEDAKWVLAVLTFFGVAAVFYLFWESYWRRKDSGRTTDQIDKNNETLGAVKTLLEDVRTTNREVREKL